jgi:hypothetical protein
MRRSFRAAGAAAALALALAGCTGEGTDEQAATGSTGGATAAESADAGESTAQQADPAERAPRDIDPDAVPVIYFDLEDGGAAPHSAVFAIDDERDGSASDDAAIRLTPDGGECNPQELRRYDFGGIAPVFGVEQAEAGIRPGEIPRYLAFVTSQEMVARGLVETVEQTEPMNICVRKLWQIQLQRLQRRQEDAPAG